jgi:hypothetical protein
MMDNIDEVTDKRMEALEEIEKDKRRVARAYNKRVKAKSFQVGDLVWKTILPIGSKSNKFGKWSPSWEVHTRLSRFVLGILTWWKLCKDSDFRGLSTEGT